MANTNTSDNALLVAQTALRIATTTIERLIYARAISSEDAEFIYATALGSMDPVADGRDDLIEHLAVCRADARHAIRPAE